MWVLERKRRPQVVCIEGVQLPKATRNTVDNSRYCTLFFRPWTLVHGAKEVPHLSLLGVTQEELHILYERFEGSVKRRRLHGKQHVKGDVECDHARAWRGDTQRRATYPSLSY